MLPRDWQYFYLGREEEATGPDKVVWMLCAQACAAAVYGSIGKACPSLNWPDATTDEKGQPIYRPPA